MAVIYEFQCPVCGQSFERDNKDDYPTCTGSGSPDSYVHNDTLTKRVWNIGGISFKGNGFYKNDNK